MKKKGILNNELSKLIAEMGHKDKMVICDCGLPIPQKVQRVDLALTRGIPGFIEVLKAVLSELVIERVILAKEIRDNNKLFCQIKDILADNISIEFIEHKEFKDKTSEVRGIVRSGEIIPYANIILVSGVNF